MCIYIYIYKYKSFCGGTNGKSNWKNAHSPMDVRSPYLKTDEVGVQRLKKRSVHRRYWQWDQIYTKIIPNLKTWPTGVKIRFLSVCTKNRIHLGHSVPDIYDIGKTWADPGWPKISCVMPDILVIQAVNFQMTPQQKRLSLLLIPWSFNVSNIVRKWWGPSSTPSGIYRAAKMRQNPKTLIGLLFWV